MIRSIARSFIKKMAIEFMAFENLIYDVQDHVATLTLNRPEKLNALNGGLQQDLRDALDEAQRDDEIRVVLLTGAGRGFCSGADLTPNPGATSAEEPTSKQNELMDDLGWVGRQALAIYNIDKPTIAVMNGVAAGAGMSLSLGCDMRIGSEKARFKTVFIERNLSPDSGMSFFLPRIVGYSRAADLIYTSRTIESDEAYRIGLLDRLVDQNVLMETAHEVAQQMAGWPPLALRTSKRVLQHNNEVELEDALRYELSNLATPRKAVNDQRESRLSFIEKRKPSFTGT